MIKLRFNAASVATMRETESITNEVTKETTKVVRTRRWIKVNVNELKKLFPLLDWKEINPREQDLANKPSKAMRNTLTKDKRDVFHYFNKGICILAKSCSVKVVDGENQVELSLLNMDEDGVCDGGHTIEVIVECLRNASIMGEKHVILEVITGVEDIIFELCRYRNTNTQVKEKALADLEGKFDFLKVGLCNEIFADNIWWTENENKNNPNKDISINLIIQILTAFNADISDREAKKTYSGSTSCETKYINTFNDNEKKHGNQLNNVYYKLSPLYHDIFNFVDYILVNMPIIYNRIGYIRDRGNFGSLRAINYKQDAYRLLFTRENTSYDIPNPLIFPILAAMRQLYKEGSNGFFEWIVDPITVFNEVGELLITKIMGIYFDKNGFVNEIGKSLQIWSDTYQIVESYLSKHMNELKILELERKIAELENVL